MCLSEPRHVGKVAVIMLVDDVKVGRDGSDNLWGTDSEADTRHEVVGVVRPNRRGRDLCSEGRGSLMQRVCLGPGARSCTWAYRPATRP